LATPILRTPARPRAERELAIEAPKSKGKAQHVWFRDSLNTLLARSVRVLELLTDVLKRLRKLADEHAQTFRSDGSRGLLATLSRELDDVPPPRATMPCERPTPAKQR
jgi:hypothetical protein